MLWSGVPVLDTGAKLGHEFHIGKRKHPRLTSRALVPAPNDTPMAQAMTMTTSIALITGGSGYFGSRLRDRLRERGQAVRVLDLADTDDRPKDVGFIQVDIRDPARVSETVKNCDA